MPGISNVDFSPSSITIARPQGLGRVFYVDGLDGDDDANGIDPGTPFKTITYALSLCLAGRNDYIIVFNHWQETVPIVVNKSRVHILGIGYPGRPMVVMNAGTDDPIFQIYGDLGDYCEIAGFDLGGGTNHAAIESAGAPNTPDSIYIHDCNFGSEYCSDTPLHGIWHGAGQGGRSWKIERCTFLGASDTGDGALISDGIFIAGGNLAHTEIVDCLFMGCPRIAINVESWGCTIRDNDIAATAAVGAGITLGAAATRCLVSGNHAAFGDDSAALNNPFADLAGVNANAWTGNYHCELPTGP